MTTTIPEGTQVTNVPLMLYKSTSSRFAAGYVILAGSNPRAGEFPLGSTDLRATVRDAILEDPAHRDAAEVLSVTRVRRVPATENSPCIDVLTVAVSHPALA